MPIASLFRSAARSWRSLSAVLLASAAAAFAQSPSAADGFDPNVDGNVYAVAQQPDGKLILAGQFSLVRPNGSEGSTRNNLARLNPDGSLDLTFDPNANGAVRTIVLQADGKILIGGDFTTLAPIGAGAPITRNRIARLNADGSLDATFNPNVGGGLAPQVYAILLQPNGGIVIGGSFTTVQPNGAATATTRNRLARLNADGSLDASFNPNANNIVFALAQHLDGKIIVAGGFTSLSPSNGETTTRNRIARLNANGTVDSEFDPNLDNRVTALAIQRDGKILVGGDFSSVKPAGNDVGNIHNRILRLTTNGQLDATFTGNASGNVAAIAVQPDGSILAGGAFSSVWSVGASVVSRPYVARFKPDGTVDLTFGAGVNALVDAFAMQPDGKLVIAGYFTGLQPSGSTSSIARNRVARLNPNGSLDATFDLAGIGRPLVEAIQKDGKIIIGGSFTSVGGATHNRLARLNADGSVDSTFNPDFNGLVLAVAVQPSDQKILVGGTFTTIGGETRNYFARLNPSGTIDSEFNPAPNGQVAAITLQSDGKIIIGGSFSTLQPIGATSTTTRNHIARLNANGTLDTAFHPNADSTVYSLAVQSDGKVLIGGAFTSLVADVDLTPVVTTNKDGTTSTTFPTGTTTVRNALARVNSDGTIDKDYNPAPNSTVNAIVLQSDGKAVIAGSFTTVRPNSAQTTTTRHRLARINTDGTVDTTYDPSANNIVLTLALQADGKILAGGPFTTLTPNGAKDFTLRKYAARINTDGTVDSAFNLDLNEVNGNRVDSWCVQADGKILLAGNFISLQPAGTGTRITTGHFARVNANGTVDTGFTPGVGGTTAGLISTLVLQPDGKVIAAGNFSEIGGTTTNNIARFNPEGTPDTGFTTTLASDGPINAVVVRPGATIVPPQNKGFAWLKGDGTLNAGFAPGAESLISGTIDCFAVQDDGHVLVGGTFTTATGIPGPNLVRFAPDGSIDANFGPSPNGEVKALVVLPDGKILVGGTFTNLGGADRPYVARLNADGTADSGFNPEPNARVDTIVRQSDGLIVLGGQFTTLNPNAVTTTSVTTTTSTPNAGSSTNTKTESNGSQVTTTISTVDGTTTTTVTTVSSTPVTRNYLARVKADGTLDTTYNPSFNSGVSAAVLQANGKIVAGGAFTSVQPGATGTTYTRNHMARINTDGTLDTGYDPNLSDAANALALYVDGKVVVGGAFTVLTPNSGSTFIRNHIARINTDGTVDTNFDPNANSTVLAIAVQSSDGAVIFGGQFTTVQANGATFASIRNHLARVDFSGALDASFNPDFNGSVSAVLAHANGSVLVGGSFTTLQPNPPLLVGGSFNTIGGVASRNLAVLGDDGSASSIFQPNPNGAVNALLVQADGKFVVAGSFTSIAGATRNNLARFNKDLTLDATYNPNVSGTLYTLALQPDGKLLIGGAITAVGSTARTGLARLNADGSLDGSFNGSTGLAGLAARELVVQGDGRILLLRDGSGVRSVLQRLNADGSPDGSFAPAFPASSLISAFALQADGRLLVAGSFATVGSVSVPSNLARLNSNGSIDASFNPAPNAATTALAVQTDGRLLVAGNFTAIGGLARGGLARLGATTAAAQAISATATSAVWARSGASPEISSAVFEQSSDASNWTTLGTAGRVSGTANWQLSGLSLPTSGLFYLRARGVTPAGTGSSSGIIETGRQINLSATPGVGPASGSVATLEIGGVLFDSATGLVTGQATPSAGSGPALSDAPIGVVATAQTSTTTVAAGSSRLVNFSARSRVTGDGALITGFAISGPGAHTVLLRAAGPGLAGFGVADALAQPRLLLYDGSGKLVLENRGWTNPASGVADLTAAMTRTGAFPFAAGGNDSAAVVTLAPGAYSMQVLDAARGSGGVTLAEAYDAGNLADASRLVNISLRGDVNGGSGAFISGFVITGNAPKRLLVRGTGPALAQFNVAGALADPVVSVFDNNGQLINANDNWSQTTADGLISANTASIMAASTSVGAFALSVGSKDAALTLTLVPGTYTVQVSGAGGTTGAALLEVYELP